jgi:thiamine-phosphate pyrophosphorylase
LIAPDLIAITDDTLSDDAIERGVRLILSEVPPGSTALQLRDRRRTTRELLALAERLRQLCARHGALLVVNDRVDIARAVDAHGVHLGHRSMGIGDARRLLGERAFVSVAAHEVVDLQVAAREGATAALLAPIYATPGKGAPRGPTFLTEARAKADNVLLYALGGIDPARAGDCVSRGAHGVAAIRSVFEPNSGACAAQAVVAAVRSHRR